MNLFTLSAIYRTVNHICIILHTCVFMFRCNTLYDIARNIGREKTLAVWRCKLNFVNIKSVKLKIQYKTTCDCRHVKVLQKSERNDTAWQEQLYSSIAKELKEDNKKVQQCHNVEVNRSQSRCPTTTPLLSTAIAYRSKSLSPLLHSSSSPSVVVHTFL